MNTNQLISQVDLEDATFYLLTSSSIERYIRLSKKIASQSALISQIHDHPEFIEAVLMRARILSQQVLILEKRDVAEFELSVLLPVLARTASPVVDEILLTLALSDRSSAAWVSALARTLRSERPSDRDIRQHFAERSFIETAATDNFVLDQHQILIEPALGIHCFKEMVSESDETFHLAA